MAKEQTSREYITKKKELGEVKIASDVVAAIAALAATEIDGCLLYTSPSPRDLSTSRMPSSA